MATLQPDDCKKPKLYITEKKKKENYILFFGIICRILCNRKQILKRFFKH